MSYPAEVAIRQDNRLPFTVRMVYDYLTTTLDFHDVRGVKSQIHSDRLGVRKASFISALNVLVATGYLKEHPRGEKGLRRFTLTWSTPEELRNAG